MIRYLDIYKFYVGGTYEHILQGGKAYTHNILGYITYLTPHRVPWGKIHLSHKTFLELVKI